MRNAAKRIGGYYPAPPEAVALAAQYLAPPDSGAPFAILDPCAGKGAAIKQLGEHLGCPLELIHAIELGDERAEETKANLPGSKVLAPCSFFGTRIMYESFSLVWCNPPFDDEIGGGQRTEHKFLDKALSLLKPGGTIVLVCPEHVAESTDIRHLYRVWCDDIFQVWFPKAVRKFREVMLFGTMRRSPGDPKARLWQTINVRPYVKKLVPSAGPGDRWEKWGFTDSELLRAMRNSPLQKRLEPPADKPLPSPPLDLGAGHIALMLASGFLDGRVEPEGEEPHVVRGSAVKNEFVTDVQEEESGKQTVTKTTYTERILLTVRAIDKWGTIHTLRQE